MSFFYNINTNVQYINKHEVCDQRSQLKIESGSKLRDSMELLLIDVAQVYMNLL